MSLEPLLDAPWEIQLHTYAAIVAFFLGIYQFSAPKGTVPHKTVGVIWIILLTLIAATSIVVRPSIYGYDLPLMQWFSWIHVLTVITIIGLVQGIYYLTRKGPLHRKHKHPFLGMFIGGLIIAGILAIALPGRVLHRAIFETPDEPAIEKSDY